MKKESEDSCSETTPLLEPDRQCCISPRYLLVILGGLGLAIEYAQRVNLSVAIVAMVKPLNTSSNSSAADEYCPQPEHQNQTLLLFQKEDQEDANGDFAWDKWTQGLILAGFFWGYACTNVMGGRASEYLGGKVVYGMGIVASSVLSLASPSCAKAGDNMFIVVRVLMGLAQGVTFPAMNTMLATWYLPLERSKFTTIVFSGFSLGTVIGMLVTGWLSSTTFLGGWPASFYIFGVLGLLWGFLWYAMVYDRPEDHPGMSPRVLQDLRDHQESLKGAERVRLRWRSVFTSIPFWGVLFASIGNDFGFYTLLTELPTFLHDVQHYQLASNGFFSALPYFLTWVFGFLWAALVNTLGQRGQLSLVWVRRLSTGMALYGPMLGLLVVAGLQCQASVALSMLCVAVMLNGACNSGYLCSHQDLAPNFAGTLLGITNTAGALMGILAPSVAGFFLDHISSVTAWRVVFLVTSGIYLVMATIYMFTIKASVQPWNYPELEDCFHPHLRRSSKCCSLSTDEDSYSTDSS